MNFKKVLAGAFASSMVAAMSVSAFAAPAGVAVGPNEDGMPAPGYCYTVEDDVTSVTFNIKFADAIDDGNTFGYNDWCPAAYDVVRGDEIVGTYGFAGAQVGWNSSLYEEEDGVVPAAGEKGYTAFEAGVGEGQVTVSVQKGDVVRFYDICWIDDEMNNKPGCPEFHYYVSTDADASADVAPIAFLASVVAVAGIAMVASKKRA